LNNLGYKTNNGIYYLSEMEEIIGDENFVKNHGKVNLIFTSPPFPLNRKKSYGNLQGDNYLEWFEGLSKKFKNILADDGSIVIELGNSWESGSPVMSTLAMKSLLGFLESGNLKLCQQFIWFNTAKLPSPAQWVNIERIRVKDSFTHIWWMSKIEKPKADNREVLIEYSDRMKKLLKRGSYNSGKRPSEHTIGEESFLNDNGGAIPPNVLVSSNTKSNSPYLRYCRDKNIVPHPARMPIDIPEFFIKFLTSPGDLVLDPFGGSNTTGQAADSLDRKWISIDSNEEYIKGSIGRFNAELIKENGFS
jgi:site-specific DNA-methyltransferase (cytosine-N4-specific)